MSARAVAPDESQNGPPTCDQGGEDGRQAALQPKGHADANHAPHDEREIEAA